MKTSFTARRPLIRAALLTTAGMMLLACSQPVIPPPEPPPPPPAAPPPEPPPPAPEPPPPPPPPPEEPLKIPSPVTFATSSDRLTSESDAALNHLKAYLEQKKQVTRFRIEGHTDSAGAKVANQKLSEARALSVASWLVNNGVDCKRLIAVGFGDSKPIADNSTPEGRAQNRRTVFINAAVDGKELGGKPVDGGGVVAGDTCAKR